MIRIFDFIASLTGLILLSPIFFILSFLILVSSGGPIFFRQERVGRGGLTFLLLKFRTMRNNSSNKSLLTVGDRDDRITKIGYFLRKYKMDEFPQLINVLKGDMSFVGPRPEVKKYVDMYSEKQREVLSVRPGITDLASIEYINESVLLSQSSDPEKTYIEEIMPHKIDINLSYLKSRSLKTDISVIFKTLTGIVK